MELQERDFGVLREVSRWRFLLGRHIVDLCGFPSQSTATRRVRLLVEGKYLNQERILYGYPPFYTLAHKGRVLIGANKRADKINVSLIPHSVAVLDTAVYFHKKLGVSDFTTEKEMHIKDGFSSRQHHPDFVFLKDGKLVAVEIELTLKAIERLRSNIKTNFMNYDSQIWVIGQRNTKMERTIIEETKNYSDIEIMYIDDIKG